MWYQLERLKMFSLLKSHAVLPTEILYSDFSDIYLSHEVHKTHLLLHITHMMWNMCIIENKQNECHFMEPEESI